MNVLVLNCGSATLKFDLIRLDDKATPTRIARGAVDRMSDDATLALEHDGSTAERPIGKVDYPQAFDAAIGALEEAGLLANIEAVGHRVVHGGLEFREAKLIDEPVVEASGR